MSGSATSALPRERSFSASHRAYVGPGRRSRSRPRDHRGGRHQGKATARGERRGQRCVDYSPLPAGPGSRSVAQYPNHTVHPSSGRALTTAGRPEDRPRWAPWHMDGTGRRPPTIDDDHRPKPFLQVSELLGGSPQAGRRRACSSDRTASARSRHRTRRRAPPGRSSRLPDGAARPRRSGGDPSGRVLILRTARITAYRAARRPGDPGGPRGRGAAPAVLRSSRRCAPPCPPRAAGRSRRRSSAGRPCR